MLGEVLDRRSAVNQKSQRLEAVTCARITWFDEPRFLECLAKSLVGVVGHPSIVPPGVAALSTGVRRDRYRLRSVDDGAVASSADTRHRARLARAREKPNRRRV
jgi:hypothetical protein